MIKNAFFPCLYSTSENNGIKDTVVGVPHKLGKKGMEEIIKIKLTPDEQAALNKSAADV